MVKKPIQFNNNNHPKVHNNTNIQITIRITLKLQK